MKRKSAQRSSTEQRQQRQSRRRKFFRPLHVEILEGRWLLASDFGDAPAPYPTLLVENGAFHTDVGPTLGANRESEADGAHSANADADDTTGAPDDEEGVTFGSIQVGQLAASVIVNVQNAVGDARLDAWIDFNGDGSWGGSADQIANDLSVINGNNTITFDVPSFAADGTTYARFRLSNLGNLAPTGPASDGEVEDYQVAILPPELAHRGLFTIASTISTAANEAREVFAADMDGDGDLDVLSASGLDDKIAWYENDGRQKFTPRAISTAADGALSVFAADVDGDGDMDVLSASVGDDKIAWYENDGRQNFTPHTISTAADGAASVIAADVDGDGDLDVLSASALDGKIAWYENDGRQNFTPRTISIAGVPASVFAADVDGDGDLDVLSASYFDDKIAWYENDGSQKFTPHTISTSANGAVTVFAADVDGDGDLDVLSASALDDKIAWYENDGGQNFTRHTISTAANGANSVFVADVDGDGDLDVLSASSDDNKIAWYENDGSQQFATRTISTAAKGARSVFAADVDGDGDLDVFSASTDDDKIAWYENQTLDFGDAPGPYPTLLAVNGARHNVKGPRLGTNRDVDLNGQVNATASGDDVNGAPDDEDGVTFGTIHVGQVGATVTVNVQNAPSFGAKLDAWVDFNGDGSWGGPLEQIVDRRVVHNGDNTLTFDVPSSAIDGAVFARFRLSSAGGLGPEGLAKDGEVEDHHVTLLPPGATAGVLNGPNSISTTANGASAVFAADMDGDGDMDVLSASINDDKIAWYENVGNQKFTARTISAAADGARSVFAADVDGDGDMDVLSASLVDDKIAWYENDGSRNFTPHTISTAANGAVSVLAADVDGDGDLDVLSASVYDDKIAWYENDGKQKFTLRTISTAADAAYSVFAADVDGDGDLDVLSASGFDDKIAWYENDGSQNFTRHTISAAANGARSVFAADVDGDGDLDVLSAAVTGENIAWYENDGSQNFTPHTISSAANGAFSVFAADVDGDLDLDVLSASVNDDKINWYENDGSQNFTRRTISTAADGPNSVFAADVDGDGDLDVLSASSGDDKIAWYENSNARPEIDVQGNAVSIADGDTTPTTADRTNFGSTIVAGGLATREFTIHNTGQAPLTLTGIPKIAVSGPNAADFTVNVNVQPTSSLAPGGSTTFQIQFDPSAPGVRSATLSIANDDADENPYDFAIQGAGTAPSIGVRGDNVLITDGDITPTTADHTDFGSTLVAGGFLSRTFTIRNKGTSDLTLTGTPKIAISGADAADFTVNVNMQPSSLIAPGGTTTFQIKFDPSGPGIRSATLSIANDDANQNPYDFKIQGTGTVPVIGVRGNDVLINDGDMTPTIADYTNFGSTLVAGGLISRIFTIRNKGTSALILTETPKVAIRGENAADFTLNVQPSSSIAAGGSTTFQIKFNPSAPGLRSAILSIANNDANENPYSFAIQGTGTAPASSGAALFASTGSVDAVDLKNFGSSIVVQAAPSAGIYDDSENPGKKVLVLVGTPGNDDIQFQAKGLVIRVQVGATHYGDFAAAKIGRIAAFGREGSDTITVGGSDVAAAILIDSWIDGGAGNDYLTGGRGHDTIYGGPGNDKLNGLAGNDVLVGGDGDDYLNGDSGRDVLIGGNGKDDLRGGNDDDLLVGGFTSFDKHVKALKLILAEWSSNSSYGTRVNHLRSGTGAILSGSGVKLKSTSSDRTVFDDRAADQLKGDNARDWFFADLDRAHADDDNVIDRKNDEWIDKLLD